jgi:hypothetical protein
VNVDISAPYKFDLTEARQGLADADPVVSLLTPVTQAKLAKTQYMFFPSIDGRAANGSVVPAGYTSGRIMWLPEAATVTDEAATALGQVESYSCTMDVVIKSEWQTSFSFDKKRALAGAGSFVLRNHVGDQATMEIRQLAHTLNSTNKTGILVPDHDVGRQIVGRLDMAQELPIEQREAAATPAVSEKFINQLLNLFRSTAKDSEKDENVQRVTRLKTLQAALWNHAAMHETPGLFTYALICLYEIDKRTPLHRTLASEEVTNYSWTTNLNTYVKGVRTIADEAVARHAAGESFGDIIEWCLTEVVLIMSKCVGDNDKGMADAYKVRNAELQATSVGNNGHGGKGGKGGGKGGANNGKRPRAGDGNNYGGKGQAPAAAAGGQNAAGAGNEAGPAGADK